jgi:hypothetical protein
VFALRRRWSDLEPAAAAPRRTSVGGPAKTSNRCSTGPGLALPGHRQLRERNKTSALLLCLNAGLRLVARERRRATDRTARLTASAEAASAAAEAGMKGHDRWLPSRRQLEQKLVRRRSTLHLAALIDLVLAHPIANVGLIAKELGVTPRAAQTLVAELGPA